ncbi:MAG TPA: hypothetical protein VEI04_07625 [Syntrophobacteria bacterium]|nr:hypothetical protein [Syntrophobacteria bacterium]
MKTEAIPYYFILILSAVLVNVGISAANMPEGAINLRDDPSYFRLLGGILDAKRAGPMEENLETLASKAEVVYQDYLRELLRVL